MTDCEEPIQVGVYCFILRKVSGVVKATCFEINGLTVVETPVEYKDLPTEVRQGFDKLRQADTSTTAT